MLLEIKNLTVEFSLGVDRFNAVDAVSLTIDQEEIVGLVGESGCGKTVTALSVLRLIDLPGRITSGEVIYKGQNLITCSQSAIRAVRGKEIAMIFQNPLAALNPLFSIETQLIDVIVLHQKCSKRQARERAIELLKTVHIPEPEKRIRQYPHQYSGGMAQRVMIAMAISAGPSLMIADEPTASLDVTIQAQIIDLLRQLNQTRKLSVLMISHDLGIIQALCQRVIVMYLGKIVEQGTIEQVFSQPKHPYTQLLLASAGLYLQKSVTDLFPEISSAIDQIKGCRFWPRCSKVIAECKEKSPQLVENMPKHWVACHCS